MTLTGIGTATRALAIRGVIVPGLCALLLASGGCATNISNVPIDNIVMVSKRGKLVDASGNGSLFGLHHWKGIDYDNLDESDDDHRNADKHIANVVAAAARARPVVRRTGSGRPLRRVTIFVHGGLNSQVTTIQRAAALAPKMSADPDVGYPVFVNWPSSLRATYFEHLFRIREGREDSRTWGYATSPFVLLTDLLTIVARAPFVWMNRTGAAIDDLKPSARADDASKDRPGHDPTLLVQCGRDERTGMQSATDTVGLFLWAPVRFLTAPIVDAFGRPSWANMKRRTEMLFHTKAEFRRSAPRREKEDVHLPSPDDTSLDLMEGASQGDLSRFFRHLEGQMDRQFGTDGWEITLIGHSMGTIVANNILRDFPDLPVENVVYMAAACSVKDYQSAVFPLLQRRPSANMWNLVLQRDAEGAERFPGIVEIAPRGSLLVWIDSFYESPKTWIDRTAGRFTNLMATEHLSRGLDDVTGHSIRSRIHIKEFDFPADADSEIPAKHGEFSTARFWERSFWELSPDDHCPPVD